MKRSQLKGALILLLAAFIWGSSFVAQSIGMEKIDAFTYNGIRTLMGAAALLPLVLTKLFKKAKNKTPAAKTELKNSVRHTLLCGAMLGLALCAASNFQQFAFYDSTPGKIAFITALYMLFVPILGLFLGKRAHILTWGCVLLGGVGLYFLSFPAGGLGSVNRGDMLALVCAVLYAVQILMVERFVEDCDPVALTFVQFLVSGAISCGLMFVFETPVLADINAVIWPLLYSGLLSCGVAYTLQTVGQKYTESTLASLIMCMESVFGVLSAAVILSQVPAPRELLGCALMLTATVSAQLIGKKSAAGGRMRNDRVRNRE